jgi:hypothetical protein
MIDRKLLIGVSTVLLLTFFDLNRSYVNQTSTKKDSTSVNNDIHDDDVLPIPPPKMKTHQAGQIIKFRYCHSCGYVCRKKNKLFFFIELFFKISKSLQTIFGISSYKLSNYGSCRRKLSITTS